MLKHDFGAKSDLGAVRASKLLLSFAGVTGLLMFTPAARFLIFLFPLASLALSFCLLRVSKSSYVELVCWLYILTPFVRRVVDYKTGSPETTLMSAPYLATAMCIFVLIPRWKQIINSQTVPLMYVFGTICYGGATTIAHFFVLGLLKGMFAWLAPLLFCSFIYIERYYVRKIYAAFERAMVYGTLVLGSYGLIQYFVFPAWDRVWMEVNQIVSIGRPEAFQVRVFSTMNAPQVLGAFLLVGILISFQSQLKMRLVAIPSGIFSLALSMSRSAWLSILVGALYLCWRLPARERTKLIMGAGACTILLLGAMQLSSVNDTLAPRFNSLLDVKHDDSAGERSDVYTTVFQTLLKSPFGLGIGVETEGGDAVSDAEHDSSFVNLLLSFGVLGSLAFVSGMFLLVSKTLFAQEGKKAAYLLPLQAAILAMIVEAFVNNVLTGPNAFLTWSVLGLGLALQEKPKRAFMDSCFSNISTHLPVEVSP